MTRARVTQIMNLPASPPEVQTYLLGLGDKKSIRRLSERRLLNEEGWNRIEEFELQSRDGVTWHTFAQGARAGRLELTFNPVTAQKVRLKILKASDVPTIWEFQLFRD